MNLTEPQAGSDLSQIQMQATPEGDIYRLKGQKIFITWGEHTLSDNIIHLVLARLPNAPAGVKGISLFLVPKYLVNEDGSLGARNEVQCLSLEHKIGIHASPTCVMQYGDHDGAIGYLIGEPHQGLKYMFTMMNGARLAVGIEGLAISEHAYQLALRYAQTRKQGKISTNPSDASVPIIEHPDIQRMLLSMRVQIEAQRALSYFAAAQLDLAQHPNPQEASTAQALANFLIPIVKGGNTESVNHITSMAIQIFGGAGYIEETGIAQLWRDGRITAIYEGTTGIQALDLISRKLIPDQGATLKRLLTTIHHDIIHWQTLPQLTIAATALKHTLSDVQNSTDYLLTHQAAAQAGAVPYLQLLGIFLGGWLLLKGAKTSIEMMACDQDQLAFYQAKLVSTHFYSATFLPTAQALAQQILQAATPLEDFQLAWFDL
jgi:acyl-CoA dehydrogenase